MNKVNVIESWKSEIQIPALYGIPILCVMETASEGIGKMSEKPKTTLISIFKTMT